MTRVVVDASVAAKWLVQEEGSDAALRLRDPAYDLACPDLLFLEVGNVLWKKVRGGEVDEADGRRMVAALLDAPLRAESSVGLLPAAWEIAVREGRSVYDGVYLALAVALDAHLVAADARLARGIASPGLASRVVQVESLSG